MPLLEDVANRMAARTLKLVESTGDEDLEKKVAEQIGASSPTLQEAFTTALRILKAEARAARFIDEIEGKVSPSETVRAEPQPEPEPEPAPEPEEVSEPDIDFDKIVLAEEGGEDDLDEIIALPSPTPGRSKKASKSQLPEL